MEKEMKAAPKAGRTLAAGQVYLTAAGCLIAGLVGGYALRSLRMPAAPPAAAAAMNPHSAMGGQMPGIDEMKRMADAKAAPLLEKLRADPNNGTLLFQVGTVYQTTHQFREAAGYFRKAADADPKNVSAHTELASCLYRTGDVDGAILELNRALAVNPNDANSLFNIGVIKWQGKGDGKGALEAWQQLLKTNPNLRADRKALVEKLMAAARTGKPPANQGAQQ